MSVPALETRGLTRRFGKTAAVDSLDLVVPAGATLGLLGPNGAGKSTTLKMVMGMLRPTAGSSRVLGTDIFKSPTEVKQQIGYVPESHQIYRWMTVDQVLRFGRAMYRTWNDTLAAELLDMFQLSKKKRVRGLSKGMLAKLSLLVALAHEPRLLILDEPLSGLDPIARDDFLEGVLRGICQEDRTVIFSSHHIDDVNRLADNVAILCEGRLLVHEPIEHLVGSAKRIRAVLRDGRLPETPPDGTVWQRVNRREWLLTVYPYTDAAVDRLESDGSVDGVDVVDLSLDDIFKDFIRGHAATC